MKWGRPFVLLVAASLLITTAAAAEPKVIALPPYLVEEKAQPLPWKYADVSGVEVLSTCPDRLTRRLVANHQRLHALLAELVPADLQFKTTAKRSLIFVDSAHQPPTSQEVVAQMALSAVDQQALDQAAAPLDDGRLRRRPPPPRYTFLPNLRLWDRDTSTLFAVVRESEFNANRVGLTPDYVAYILRNRRPSLPPWFISGVITLFSRASFSEDALSLDRIDWPLETGSAALKAGPEANRALIPLADFFAGELSSEDHPGSAEGLSRWQAQAALFLRWGLAGRGLPRRSALWKFAERSSVEPVTEALFQECFGLSFADAQKELAALLPEALLTRLPLRPAQFPRLPDYELRPASAEEIARLKGDWERLEIGYVKTQFPALTEKYTEQARRTLRRAYDAGSRDPQLVAVMGLCEVDAGNDLAARDFLEDAATRSQTLRPRVWFELARLRFAALHARGQQGSTLTPVQLRSVLEPLNTARVQQPPLAEAYELMAAAWAVSATAPTLAELSVLEEAVRLFPHRSDLVYRTAELNLRHGFAEAARWLITLGLKLSPDAGARARFEALQQRTNGNP